MERVNMANDARYFFDLLLGMTEKELRARYKYTVLGFLWIVLNPLLQMLVIGFVFPLFIKEPIEHYYYYLFIGLLLWNFFSLSVTKATPSIVYERALIKKSKFPRSVIPLSIVLSNLVHFALALGLFLMLLLPLGTMAISRVPHLLLGFMQLVIFTTGLSLFTTALNIRFRDINFFVQAVLIIWFYATPIVYSISFVPYRFIWLWRLNPLTSTVQLFQHGFLNAPAPGPFMLTANLVVIFLVSVVGIAVFRSQSKNFDDWV